MPRTDCINCVSIGIRKRARSDQVGYRVGGIHAPRGRVCGIQGERARIVRANPETWSQFVGCRRCQHCTSPIVCHEAMTRRESLVYEEWYAAWLAGFCTPMCQRNHALQQVATKQAWWMKEERK